MEFGANGVLTYKVIILPVFSLYLVGGFSRYT